VVGESFSERISKREQNILREVAFVLGDGSAAKGCSDASREQGTGDEELWNKQDVSYSSDRAV
jgi:hypothetical protein